MGLPIYSLSFKIKLELGKNHERGPVKYLYFSTKNTASLKEITNAALSCLIIYDDQFPEDVKINKKITFSQYYPERQRVYRGGIKGYIQKKEDDSFTATFTNSTGTSYV